VRVRYDQDVGLRACEIGDRISQCSGW
jgi:hypothetical protein